MILLIELHFHNRLARAIVCFSKKGWTIIFCVSGLVLLDEYEKIFKHLEVSNYPSFKALVNMYNDDGLKINESSFKISHPNKPIIVHID